jgi:hypothetical protein
MVVKHSVCESGNREGSKEREERKEIERTIANKGNRKKKNKKKFKILLAVQKSFLTLHPAELALM